MNTPKATGQRRKRKHPDSVASPIPSTSNATAVASSLIPSTSNATPVPSSPNSSSDEEESGDEMEQHYHDKSPAWKEFNNVEKRGEKAVCKRCAMQIACWKLDPKSKNLVRYNKNLKQHLRTHKIEVEAVNYEQKNGVRCFYCSTSLHKDNLTWSQHFRACSNAKNFYGANGWSRALNAAASAPVQSVQATPNGDGNCTVYLVREHSGDLLKLRYVGLTGIGVTLQQRFQRHVQRGTFAKEKGRLEYAALQSGMSKQEAELLEALLILSGRIKTKLVNEHNEARHLLHLPSGYGSHHEAVLRFHTQAVNQMAAKWRSLQWIEFHPNLTDEERKGTKKRGQKNDRPLYPDLVRQLAESEQNRKTMEDERKRMEDERKRMEDERKRMEDERKRMEDERKRMEDERRKWKRRAHGERKRRKQEEEEGMAEASDEIENNELDQSFWSQLSTPPRD